MDTQCDTLWLCDLRWLHWKCMASGSKRATKHTTIDRELLLILFIHANLNRFSLCTVNQTNTHRATNTTTTAIIIIGHVTNTFFMSCTLVCIVSIRLVIAFCALFSSTRFFSFPFLTPSNNQSVSRCTFVGAYIFVCYCHWMACSNCGNRNVSINIEFRNLY